MVQSRLFGGVDPIYNRFKLKFYAMIGGCPRIDFYCDRLQILMAALSSPKRPQRRLLLRLRPFWPCRLALKIFARSRYEAILGQPPRVKNYRLID